MACEAHDLGQVEIARSDIAAAWARPGFDQANASTGVFEDGRLVGYAEVFMGRAEAAVDPGHRGRGIGTALLRWTWAVARADDRDSVGQTIGDVEVGASALLAAHGYEPTHTAWLLQIPLTSVRPDPPALPAGLKFRAFEPGQDDREIFDVIDTAFDEWPGRESHGFENWLAESLRRPEVNEDLLVLIADGGRIVGVALNFDLGPDDEGWIEQVAVDAAYRGRGLGKALLLESFRRFAALGRSHCGLSTDSRTGALGLYEHVGMHVRSSYTRWTKDLQDLRQDL